MSGARQVARGGQSMHSRGRSATGNRDTGAGSAPVRNECSLFWAIGPKTLHSASRAGCAKPRLGAEQADEVAHVAVAVQVLDRVEDRADPATGQEAEADQQASEQ